MRKRRKYYSSKGLVNIFVYDGQAEIRHALIAEFNKIRRRKFGDREVIVHSIVNEKDLKHRLQKFIPYQIVVREDIEDELSQIYETLAQVCGEITVEIVYMHVEVLTQSL